MTMRRSSRQVFQGLFAATVVASVLLSPALAAEKKDFKVAWSIYVGWMPWGYATEAGIVKKWADKYGINIEVSSSTTTSSRSINTLPARSMR
jgi:NitT/TauT family transport system substrate-binding protein